MKTKGKNGPLQVTVIVAFLFFVIVAALHFLSKPKPEHAWPQKILTPKPKFQPTPIVKKSYPLPLRGTGKIAFIIDDWGYSMNNCKYLQSIPEPLAVSILPGLRHTKDIAQCAVRNHKLTMLHLPLEALHNTDYYPKNYVIKTTMADSLVKKILNGDLNQLPLIEGVNNHMGSKATENTHLMGIILKKLKSKNLFFIDSMTAPHSICEKLASDMNLAFGKRDIFLDNANTKEAITKQIMVLAQRARRYGYAVAICHDRRLTMQVLAEKIPWLETQGFRIVSIKDLIKK